MEKLLAAELEVCIYAFMFRACVSIFHVLCSLACRLFPCSTYHGALLVSLLLFGSISLSELPRYHSDRHCRINDCTPPTPQQLAPLC